MHRFPKCNLRALAFAKPDYARKTRSKLDRNLPRFICTKTTRILLYGTLS